MTDSASNLGIRNSRICKQRNNIDNKINSIQPEALGGILTIELKMENVLFYEKWGKIIIFTVKGETLIWSKMNLGHWTSQSHYSIIYRFSAYLFFAAFTKNRRLVLLALVLGWLRSQNWYPNFWITHIDFIPFNDEFSTNFLTNFELFRNYLEYLTKIDISIQKFHGKGRILEGRLTRVVNLKLDKVDWAGTFRSEFQVDWGGPLRQEFQPGRTVRPRGPCPKIYNPKSDISASTS